MDKIDQLAYQLAFEQNKEIYFQEIKKIALEKKIFPASLFSLYQKFAKEQIKEMTIPAINIKTLTYDIACLLFNLIKSLKLGPIIFELARSEISYTNQTPKEYAGIILAAAVKENYQGPVFIQADHYQVNLLRYQKEPSNEIEELKKLIKESIEAGFYNIDIDASTLVNLEKPTLKQQQEKNYQLTAFFTKYIRKIEPKKIKITIGGEIGHIGGKNTTVKEFETFMKGYLSQIQNSKFNSQNEKKIEGISKISIQTGSTHGGIPLPDGKLAKVNIDFNLIKKIGEIARKKYHLGGVVQHGASTLPEELFSLFPKFNTLEIHLGTEFLNIVFDQLPKGIRKEIYSWIKTNLKSEWKKDWTEEQFIYKIRKKALKIFKKNLWLMNSNEKKPIIIALKEKFTRIFKNLNVVGKEKILKEEVFD